MNEETIFAGAIQCETDQERSEYLDEACSGDGELRARVDELLRAHVNPDSLFNSPAVTDADSSAIGQHLPKQLGDFEIIRELGRGGMGIVYEAQQQSLNRRVALKVLSSGLGLTSKAVMRFRREAEAAAKLHHTNIVPIYATGEDRGVHFYAMELIQGPSLDLVIKHMRGSEVSENENTDAVDSIDLPDWVDETIAFERPASSSEASAQSSTSTAAAASSTLTTGSGYSDAVAKMMAEVADALEHAHDQGVIHRDIKPSNLLLGPDGRLSINDFGLARMLEQPGMTMTGEFVGSPLYMSPEQITAGRAPLDHRTDIYSLGASLYELLTLQPPHPGQRRDQVIAHALQKEPIAPRRLNKRIPRDLETICLKAIEKDPDRRYQSATQMANDLRHFVSRFSISARRVGPAGRAAKWIRRNRTISLLGLLLILTACASLGMLYRRRLDRLDQIAKAKDALLLHALNDQFDDAHDEHEVARKLGANAGELALMKAQIDLLEEKSEDVVNDLKQRERELGDSTAAYAMLTVAYMYTGREADCFARLAELIDRTPRDYQDYLLRGWAVLWNLPDLAVKDLEEAIRLRHSNVANVLLAEALTWRALSSPNKKAALKDVRRALKIVRAVRDLTPVRKPWTEGIFVFATLVEADLVTDNRDARIDHLLQIRDEVKYLGKWIDLSEWACLARYSYWERSGSMRDLFADFEGGRSPKSPYAHVHHVIELFREHRDQDARRAFTRISPSLRLHADHMLTYIEMSSPNADRDRIASEFLAARRRLSGDSAAAVFRHFDIWALQLLGESTEAKRLARTTRRFTRRLEKHWPVFKVGNLITGDCSEEQLLDDCSDDRGAMVHALFAIGVNNLAMGNRPAAEERFKQVLETDQFPFYVYSWSAAFLQRMQDDPKWLPWLPQAKERQSEEPAEADGLDRQVKCG